MPSQYVYDMSDTWNSGITTYTSIKMNVTNSASAADSLLMDLQIGSSSKFKIDKNGNATLINSDAGASAGPVLTFWRDSASPAASDIIGKILFQGEDDGGNAEDYSEIYAQITDPAAGTEDATLYLRTKIAGTMTTVMTISASGVAVTGNVTVTGDVLPEADGTRDLGSSSVRWAEMHSDTVLTDLLRGATTAGSLPVQGEGTATTNLQQGLAKAWANLNGTGTIALRDSFNVGSVTDNGTGNYTVSFTNAFATTGYSAVVSQTRFSAASFNDITQIEANGQLTGSVATRTSTTTYNYDPDVVSITATGDLA